MTKGGGFWNLTEEEEKWSGIGGMDDGSALLRRPMK